MGKVKVVNTNLDQNLNGTNFNNTASETIFQFGKFSVTSNFQGRKYIDYTNTLSSFVRPITLETLGLNEVQSIIVHDYQVNAVLNLDKSNLNTFVRFGSTYEFFRVSVQEIILKYPGSLFANSNAIPGGNPSFDNLTYDAITNISKFRIPAIIIANTFGLVFNQGNVSKPNDMEIRNLNLSYEKYVVWSKFDPSGIYPVIGFTGDTQGIPYVWVKTQGNPFSFLPYTPYMSGSIDFHIKPNNFIFEEFRAILTSYEQYIMSQRITGITTGFQFLLNDPTLLDDGNITYGMVTMLWTTSDGYNIDISGTLYQRFLESLLTIGSKYDSIKTDLIARFLTPTSIKTYDLTEEGKMTKLLRVFGWEFDQLRQFIDSLVNINTVTYNKLNNIPDQLVSNLARTFGWDYFTLVNEGELVNNFLSIDDAERNLNTDLMPAEVNIELWRRILINTNYFWKSKGTREAIKSIFLLIGIPEPFINITEYVYTVNGKINPNTVPFVRADFPNASLPYDNSGYPLAPIESNNFYFQIAGNTDSGQEYLDTFRKAGFNLQQTPDNKKSWIQAGAVTRQHYSTPQYTQEDSKLVINTKEVDVALDTARGIEYDVWDYIQKDFAANSSGYTLPFSYVNISLGVSASQATFQMPQKTQGDFEVRYNGILLNVPKTGNTSGTTTGITYQADYVINYAANTFTLTGDTGAMFAINSGNRRDVIQATYIYSGASTAPKEVLSAITVQYVVTRVNANLTGTYIPLPSYPRGDVQVTINGIALTKGTPQFIADYILDPANSTGGSNNIIIQNPVVISYLAENPTIQIAYLQVVGSNAINARSEVVRIDSFNSSKIYFNPGANKYVYKLNYKINNVSEVKILIDGIALEPGMDYTLNVQNPYEIFLPRGLNYGSVISAYYLVALSSFFSPIVADNFGVGDISQLSFLEFIEMIQRRLINARNRKTISDFKGGWYPALLNVYVQYLKRGLLPYNNPLHSNGYTFENLYPFLSKYNAFFNRFVDELLSATIILRQSGLLVRNTVFTKQKFMYKRGVNLYSGGSTTIDKRGNPILFYLGDDGSQFLIDQNIYAPIPPATVIPTVITNPMSAITISGATGGGNVLSSGGAPVTSRGICWSTSPNPTIAGNFTVNGSGTGIFTSPIIGLVASTIYYVRAYAINGVGVGYGQQIQFTTAAVVINTTLQTRQHTSVTTSSIVGTGGISILPSGTWSNVSFYNMQYRIPPSLIWQQTPSLAGPLAVDNFTTTISGLSTNTKYQYQSHMVVGGNDYYGTTILSGKTTAIIPVLPTVTTGTQNHSLDTTYNITIDGNNVTSAGTSPVSERGLVWSLSPNPTNANNIENNGSGLGTYGVTAWCNTPDTYLSPNTSYYAKAYACSAVGIAYGSQITMTTLSPKAITLNRSLCVGANGSAATTRGYNITSVPPMIAGESYCLCMEFPLGMSPALFGTGSFTSVAISCNSNPICFACITNQACCIPNILCTMNYGDTLFVTGQWTSTTTLGVGGLNACVCIRSVTPISGAFGISTVCYKDCAYTG